MHFSVKTWSRFIIIALLLTLSSSTIMAGQDYERIINRAYEDILNRRADPGGMRNFRIKMIDDGWSEQDVRNALRNSPEAKKENVNLIVKRAYQDLLGRDPDRGGYEMYKERITVSGWSEADVRNNIKQSQEYKNKH